MIKQSTIALFGEAEKGAYKKAYFCNSLPELVDLLGHPPPDSKGLHYAIQAILYQYELIFFRVREEGFSFQDYFWGFNLLTSEELIEEVSAICIPGVGDVELIDSITPVCLKSKSFLIITEPDLYDFLNR